MARVEKNAAGKDVRVDTEAYGCVTIAAQSAPASPAASTTKPAGGKTAERTSNEGEN